MIRYDLQLFAMNTNVTGDGGLSPEMKTYYEKSLIRTAEPLLVHDQFGQKKPIPKNGGKTIEFRRYASLPKMLAPLVEGQTPDGQKLTVSSVTGTVAQYGGYIAISDVRELTAIDNNLDQATELIGSQAGRTLDTITREVINGGTNVNYGAEAVSARYLLVGGDATPANNNYLTWDCIKRAVHDLKVQNAMPMEDGRYVAIIHPSCSYDLTNDPKWIAIKNYDPADPYYGEIGMIENVRFVETTEAKIFHADGLRIEDGSDAALRTLTVASYSSKVITIDEKLTADQAAALVGRKIIVKGQLFTVSAAAAGAAGAATITIAETPTTNPADNDVVYPGEAGAAGRDVYSTLVIGRNAYGVTEVEGGGLQHIFKPLGSGEDPLNQRATVGWKALKTAEILVNEYMVRVETTSVYQDGAN